MISESSRANSPASRSNGAPLALIVADGVTLRRVQTLAEYQECVAIQEEVWGNGFSERVPATILMVAQKLDGVVAAAFAGDHRMLGFVFGLTGLRDGRLSHWSDMLAVRAEARGAHIGERLKHFQRDLVRGMGVDTMYWTFDPLVARNAHLNLVRLGARAAEYVANMYGDNTGSPLHGGLDTDRIVAEWDLAAPHAARTHDAMAARSPRAGIVVNPPGPGGAPALTGLPDVPAVRVVVPHDVHELSYERRAAWRAVTRAAFVHYMARGYSVVGFQRAADGGRGGAGELPFYELARIDQLGKLGLGFVDVHGDHRKLRND